MKAATEEIFEVEGGVIMDTSSFRGEHRSRQYAFVVDDTEELTISAVHGPSKDIINEHLHQMSFMNERENLNLITAGYLQKNPLNDII